MKRLQNFYLFSYRFIGFIFLVGLISSILWYGFSIIFFLTNSNWSLPFILSSNQENVLIHQERVLNMEYDLLKNTIELKTAKDALANKKAVLVNAEELYARIEQSMLEQSKRYIKNGAVFQKLSTEKAKSVLELSSLLAELRNKEAAINKELQLNLITRQEALSQRVTLSNARSNLIDAKERLYDLKERNLDSTSAVSTLNGSAMNLSTLQKLVKKFDLSRQISQLKSDLFSLKITIEQLGKNIEKKNKVLSLMKKSPYILATSKPVHVAFVPYSNFSHVLLNEPIYSCYLDFILCYKAGQVTQIYTAEEYSKHPIFKSDIKGQYVGIQFIREADAQKKLLFLNSKPLLI